MSLVENLAVALYRDLQIVYFLELAREVARKRFVFLRRLFEFQLHRVGLLRNSGKEAEVGGG